jgi:hypothetical protein
MFTTADEDLFSKYGYGKKLMDVRERKILHNNAFTQ